ncbi:murein DD-endopeptidase MepM/ murein hydrolase activator NlpD [Dysgonomonas sp. PFB1-18]|uniref:M56 family metallopeptidase n=1 Tax=unclassified Dysgonomonas TaxID=2630389 RepID=UPI0024754FE8|nr:MULTISPECIES: M23/M56 family metallopeptidase [unclassified Dysgonomonas]MDH6307742.1 murein DD-endopeptidase MepM/ murein hydrolase activator NlpD [Dysgonomonas sp. PF1-14]MDH6337660.1 murein DD-endopeptidase MepM/ murein hydrolase activator NlpD [Dysgonomonas sp. PF1-16]MDH6378884.1 murein DD-endopeptidase MepM/ murein hydrolase activator NlpD [Dysgonomonas sp. PFB1-18]MDH6396519.1 murein DD-endopeptidase MepM/ murein hydrolase activator NlpD [Dysgonomonas sp. PF1-23]
MDVFLIYIFKSAIYLILLYICIRAFFSKETFFGFNRWVLLSGTLICMLLPLVRITIEQPSVIQQPFAMIEEAIVSPNVSIPDQYTSGALNTELTDIEEPAIFQNSSVYTGKVLAVIYLIGGFLNILILLRSVLAMWNLIRKGRKVDYSGYTLVLVSNNISPFSWGQYIVLSEDDYKHNPEEILVHELAHIRHRHSADLIFLELILLIQWFNPAMWLLKREMKDIHEYQADMCVLQSGIDAKKYQLLLVKKAVGSSSYTLANSFNHSKIKKRITMMLKEKSNKWAQLKLLLLLPIVSLTAYAFARPEVRESLDSITHHESTNKFSYSAAETPLFSFPLPASTEVLAKYENKGTERFPSGYDLKGQENDSILAAFGGTVIASDMDKVLGNYIVIDHGLGITTLYAHNSKNLVTLNKAITAGTVIGITGSTGVATEDYLHFEIRKDGVPIDATLIIDFEKKTLKPDVDYGKVFSINKSSEKDYNSTYSYTSVDSSGRKNRKNEGFEKSVKEYLAKVNYSTEKDRIGEPSAGKYQLVYFGKLSNSKADHTKLYPSLSELSVFPEFYSKKIDPKDSDYLRLYWYVADGKKLSRTKFLDRFYNGKIFFEKDKIKPEDGVVTELYGITTDGAKTPVFYMVMPKK